MDFELGTLDFGQVLSSKLYLRIRFRKLHYLPYIALKGWTVNAMSLEQYSSIGRVIGLLHKKVRYGVMRQSGDLG